MTLLPAPHYEPRPRDFGARFGRKRVPTIGLRRRRKHRGRRLAVLLAAVAVPAFAAPDEWGSFDIGNAGNAVLVLEQMPFEKPGDSFPGSAFYYLAPDSPAPVLADGAQWEGTITPLPEDPMVGPAARAIRIDNSGVDRGRALDCLTAAVYYEAASEPDAGQRAVAQVVLNRVAHTSYPNTVCGVVYQGSERPSCQFSFACDGSMARKPMAAFWDRARRVASDALAGYVYAPAGLATHYHTTAVHPYWAPSLTFLGTIGAHRFYRWAGNAGKPAAFTALYSGGEPLAAPHPRTWTPLPADVADPLALERAFEQGKITANATALPTAPMAAPIYSAPIQQRGGEALFKAEPANSTLSGSGAIRPEYENAGRWIAQPGS